MAKKLTVSTYEFFERFPTTTQPASILRKSVWTAILYARIAAKNTAPKFAKCRLILLPRLQD